MEEVDSGLLMVDGEECSESAMHIPVSGFWILDSGI